MKINLTNSAVRALLAGTLIFEPFQWAHAAGLGLKFGGPSQQVSNSTEEVVDQGRASADYPAQEPSVGQRQQMQIVVSSDPNPLIQQGMLLMEYYQGQNGQGVETPVLVDSDGKALLGNKMITEQAEGKRLLEIQRSIRSKLGTSNYDLGVRPYQSLVKLLGARGNPTVSYVQPDNLSGVLAQGGGVSGESNYRIMVYIPSRGTRKTYNYFDVVSGKNDKWIPPGSTVDLQLSSLSLINRHAGIDLATKVATIVMGVTQIIILQRQKR